MADFRTYRLEELGGGYWLLYFTTPHDDAQSGRVVIDASSRTEAESKAADVLNPNYPKQRDRCDHCHQHGVLRTAECYDAVHGQGWIKRLLCAYCASAAAPNGGA